MEETGVNTKIQRSKEYQREVDFKEIFIRGMIMSYAFSLVVLGSHDIRRDYGSVTNYLSGKSSKYVKKIDKELPDMKWKKVSRLFTRQRAEETWKIKSREYLKNPERKNIR